jgi:hypothetical protein
MRAHVEVVPSLPCGGEVLHDEESGLGLVVWVTDSHITAPQAAVLEDEINRKAQDRGRQLTVAEVLELLPFVA